MAKDITLEKYEKFALYVLVFTVSVMFSIFYENTKFTFGSLVDIHSQFNDVHIFLLAIGVFNLIGMQWSKNKSYQLRMELQKGC